MGTRLYATRAFEVGELVIAQRCDMKALVVAKSLGDKAYITWSCGGFCLHTRDNELPEHDGI